jgi:thiol-disulfide isomerase/thioredoxin
MNDQPGQSTATAGGIIGGIALVVLVLGLSTWVGFSFRETSSEPPEPSSTPTPVLSDRESNLAAMGGLVYQVHCTRCHGVEGHGNGLDATVLKPPPRDFAGRNWRHERTFESIHRVTAEGIPETAMIGFSRVLSSTELEAVSSHVAGLASQAKRLEPLAKAAGFVSEVGDPPAPDWTLVDLDGKKRKLEDFRGRVVLIDFWGTSCSSCVMAMPHLANLANERRAEGLEVLPICVGEDDPERVKWVLNRSFKLLTHYIDDGMARQLFDVQNTPTILLIGRDGRLIARTQGLKGWGTPKLKALLDAALAQ